MELVYLWVEDYKNIHEQGFNFSSRFNCDYNKKTNELTIEEKDDYIPDFFAKNINVTAIVGKNGSGKSSIFEILKDKDRKITEISWDDTDKTTYNRPRKKEKNLIVYYKNNKFYFIYKNNVEIINNPQFILEKSNENKRYFIEMDNLLNNDDNRTSFYEKFKFILEKNNDFFHFVNEEFIFDKFYFYTTFSKIQSRNNGFFDEYFNKNEESRERLLKILSLELVEKVTEKLSPSFMETVTFGLSKKITNLFTENNSDEEIKNQKFSEDRAKIKQIVEKEFTELSYEQITNMCKYYEVYNAISISDIDEFLKYFEYHKLEWRTKKFDFDYDVKEIQDLKLYQYLIKENYLEENFLNEKFPNYTYQNLSLGEKSLLTLLTNFVYSLYDFEDDEVVVLFDEIELSFHPDWQKNLLYFLLHSYTNVKSHNRKLKIHLLLTTHSPFLLSDFPKQNIIFLEKEKSGNCKVLNHDEVLEKKQTFGANIHTLLSDSFFMNNGLMGKFSKDKISEIKKLYQLIKDENIKERLKKQRVKELAQKAFYRRRKRLWQIQKIIGEPFLQKVIKNYLDELEIFFSDDKTLIDKELQEIEERRKYLEALKRGKK